MQNGRFFFTLAVCLGLIALQCTVPVVLINSKKPLAVVNKNDTLVVTVNNSRDESIPVFVVNWPDSNKTIKIDSSSGINSKKRTPLLGELPTTENGGPQVKGPCVITYISNDAIIKIPGDDPSTLFIKAPIGLEVNVLEGMVIYSPTAHTSYSGWREQ